jgi:prepilin-type processing-associated H-X9-DG protein
MVDSQFGNPVGDSSKTLASSQYWYDLPSDRHNMGCNLSFTDAHVEHTRWKVAKKGRFFSGGTKVSLAAGELPDLQYIQSRMKWWSDN